ncbi:MAG: NAD(+)/NADH kinase [Actinomycetota bacterium]|nr:NAD(+)/NADH kinase [Actinomycetota bacterium]HWM32805.1 diacylglycerol kinase family protein [Pseudolysinimonas sp.]
MSAARTAQRAAVVYNPTKVELAELRNAVALAESEAGWAKSLWIETTEEDPGTGQAREAVERGADVVIAAGGDGTVRAVAEGLHGSNVPLTLLPAGTGNLLARNMDLTLADLPGSVQTAFTGHDRRIDLGIVEVERVDGTRETRAFVVMAGIGLDAKMAANTDPELKKKVGWLAYIQPIVRAMSDQQRVRVRFRIDDGPERTMNVHTVMVGNCGSLPGNVLLLPEAAIDDGVFDIVALRPKGFFGWVQIWTKIFWENGVLRRNSVGRRLAGLTREVRALRYIKAATITARLDRAEDFELDGDDFGDAIAFRAHVERDGLLVRIPADREIEGSDQEAGVASA